MMKIVFPSLLQMEMTNPCKANLGKSFMYGYVNVSPPYVCVEVIWSV